MLSILPRVGVGSPPGSSHRAEGIIARLRGSAREKYNPWGPPHDVALPGGGIPPGGVLALTPPREGRHHIAREPRQLVLEALEEDIHLLLLEELLVGLVVEHGRPERLD